MQNNFRQRTNNYKWAVHVHIMRGLFIYLFGENAWFSYVRGDDNLIGYSRIIFESSKKGILQLIYKFNILQYSFELPYVKNNQPWKENILFIKQVT